MHRFRPAAAAVAASLLAMTILGTPPSRAQVEACAGVASIEPSLAALTGTTTPAGERPEALRFPVPADVSGAAVSFWDYVPDPFFVALTVPRGQVEAMGAKDWIEAVTGWNRFQQGLRNPLGPSAPPSTYFEIDWMFALAKTGEPLAQRDWIEAGIGSDVEVDSTVDGVRLVGEPITEDRLWLMVAGLYARHRLTPSSLLRPENSSSFDAFWQAFPDGSSTASTATERERLRRYLCNHPAVRLTGLEVAAADPAVREAGEGELSAFVENTLADFDELASFLRPGSSLDTWLDLVPQDSIRGALRSVVVETGPAKAYVLLKETLYEGIARKGEIARKQAIWRTLPGFAQFLWPDPCLRAAVYPSGNSPLFGPPWVMQTACRSTVEDRNALRVAIEERQP